MVICWVNNLASGAMLRGVYFRGLVVGYLVRLVGQQLFPFESGVNSCFKGVGDI